MLSISFGKTKRPAFAKIIGVEHCPLNYSNEWQTVKLLERLSDGPPYYFFNSNYQIGFRLFWELWLVSATSAQVDGPTLGEYAATLHKLFQVSKVSVSIIFVF